MQSRQYAWCVALAGAAMMGGKAAHAYEAGYPGWSMPPGVVLGMTAATPAPGFYSFNEVYTAQAHRYGPGDPSGATPIRVASPTTACGPTYTSAPISTFLPITAVGCIPGFSSAVG